MNRLYLYIMLCFCFACTTEEPVPQAMSTEAVSVFIKNYYDSKTDNYVTLYPDVDKTNIEFVCHGLLGKIKLDQLLHKSTLSINRLTEMLEFRAGVYTLYASVDGGIIDKTSINIQPQRISGQSTNFISPKTTSFGDTKGSMITGFFVDEHNNLVDTTLILNYQIQSDNIKTNTQVDTDHNYYFTHIIPSKNNTIQLVGVSTKHEYSDKITTLGSSGCPSTGSISVSDRYDVADGHQIFKVSVTHIQDEESHIVSDGTYLTLRLESEKSMSQYQGIVINGNSSFTVINPSIAGTYTISITSCNTVICSLNNLSFKSVLTDIPYETNSTEVIIGPLLSELNQIIPDGTLVKLFPELCPDLNQLTTIAKNGLATFKKDILYTHCPSSNYTINIGGVQSQLLLTKLNNNDL